MPNETRVIIQIIEDAAGFPCAFAGYYLADCDFEADEGFARLALTPYPSEAKTFATPKDALAFYQTVPKCHPRRADGRPNRPLTAYTVELKRIVKEAA